MLCCIPALYVWLASRIGERTIGVKCPVELVTRGRPEVKGAREWRDFFAGLNETKIQWQPSWQLGSRLIYYCGKYPNVPLVGTRCCINYNPVLAQRQFGYPIRGAPTPASLTAMLFYYEDGDATKVL